MKRIIASTLFLLIPFTLLAEDVEIKPLIEVRVSSGGMVAFAGEYLHLRVFSDGRVEYEDKKDGESEWAPRSAKLSATELFSLKEFLDRSVVRELKPKYAPASPTLDHYTLIKISINQLEQAQSIEIPNYNLPIGRDKGLYPQALINLMCRIERVRGTASTQLTAKGWCTVWSK